MKTNMADILAQRAERQPEHPAIIEADEQITYGALQARIQEAAEALERGGVRAGHTVGLHLASGVDYIVQTYAIWFAGAITVPIATELARDEKADVLRNIAVDYLVSTLAPLDFGEGIL